MVDMLMGVVDKLPTLITANLSILFFNQYPIVLLLGITRGRLGAGVKNTAAGAVWLVVGQEQDESQTTVAEWLNGLPQNKRLLSCFCGFFGWHGGHDVSA